jgi:hypothetical protein
MRPALLVAQRAESMRSRPPALARRWATPSTRPCGNCGTPARQAIGATIYGGMNEIQREIIAKANGL